MNRNYGYGEDGGGAHGYQDPASTSPKKRGRGRSVDVAWGYFTTQENAHMATMSQCMHCADFIHHHRQVKRIKTHLTSQCPPFAKKMEQTSPEHQPNFFTGEPNVTKESASKKAATAAAWMSSSGSHVKTETPQYHSHQAAASGSGSSSVKKMSAAAMAAAATPQALESYAPSASMSISKKVSVNKVHEAVAMFFYTSSTPFQDVENPYLHEAFHIAKPGWKDVLPDQRQLETTLLDRCLHMTQQRVAQNMADETVCLVSNGWLNVKNGRSSSSTSTKYLVYAPKRSFFLESVANGHQGSPDQVVNEYSRLSAKHANTVFSGAVTDVTSTNSKAWKLLKAKFPLAYFHGCCSHALHLMIKDVLAASKTMQTGVHWPRYPPDYPFEPLLQFVNSCKLVVYYFRNLHTPDGGTASTANQVENDGTETAATLTADERRQEEKLMNLPRPAANQWGTIPAMLVTLKEASSFLDKIVNDPEFVQGTPAMTIEKLKVKEFLSEDNYAANLDKAVAIIEPIQFLLKKYQSNKAFISDVIPDFMALSNMFQDLLSDETIEENECKYLKKLVKSRLRSFYGKAHGLSNLLDPRYLGRGLPEADRETLEDLLSSTPPSDTVAVDTDYNEALYNQFANFRGKVDEDRGKEHFRYTALVQGKKSPLEYWRDEGYRWPDLQRIAIKLFTMAPSSAAAERNVSVVQATATSATSSSSSVRRRRQAGSQRSAVAAAAVAMDKLEYIQHNDIALSNVQQQSLPKQAAAAAASAAGDGEAETATADSDWDAWMWHGDEGHKDGEEDDDEQVVEEEEGKEEVALTFLHV